MIRPAGVLAAMILLAAATLGCAGPGPSFGNQRTRVGRDRTSPTARSARAAAPRFASSVAQASEVGGRQVDAAVREDRASRFRLILRRLSSAGRAPAL